MNPRTQESVALLLRKDAMCFSVALFLAFATGCEKTPTAPDTTSLRFTARAADAGSAESVTAEAGQRQIAVRAVLIAPDPCQTLEAEFDQADGELTIRVFIRRSGAGPCVQPIGRFAYDAVIEGLRQGTYGLQVVHTYPSTGWSTQTVLRQTLHVR